MVMSEMVSMLVSTWFFSVVRVSVCVLVVDCKLAISVAIFACAVCKVDMLFALLVVAVES